MGELLIAELQQNGALADPRVADHQHLDHAVAAQHSKYYGRPLQPILLIIYWIIMEQANQCASPLSPDPLSSLQGPVEPSTHCCFAIDEKGRIEAELPKSQRLSADCLTAQLLTEERRLCCVDPLCFEQSRVFTRQACKLHQKHSVIDLDSLLKKLEILKCNQSLKNANSQRVQFIIQAMDKIYLQILDFQTQVLQTLSKLKTQTLRHINEVKSSFSSDHFQWLRSSLLKQFDFANVRFALGEIQKYEKLRYLSLDYPFFKVGMLQKRCAQLSAYKAKCLSELKTCVSKFYGDNSQFNRNKQYSRSLTTFMYKGVSQQLIFSYHLRHFDYLATNQGKKLKRIQMDGQIPVAVIQKQVDCKPIKIRVLKSCIEGMAIGCGTLPKMQKYGFESIYSSGYFLQNTGFVLSNKSRYKNGFKFGQSDVISIRKEQRKLFFNKIRQGSVVQGFYIDLQQNPTKGLAADQQIYVAAMLGSLAAEVEIVE